MPARRLPPELCDEVIAHLSGDTRALTACATVCKDWVPASRFVLFNNTVDRDSDPPTRVAVVASKTLLELMGSPHCTLKDISTLHVRTQPTDSACLGASKSKYMVRRLANFRALRHLYIHGLNFRKVSRNILSNFTTSSMASIRELRIDQVQFTSQDQMLAFIRAYPFLEVLVVDGISNAEEIEDHYQHRPTIKSELNPESSLRTLKLCKIDSYIVSILAWLLATPTPHLRRVDLNPSASPMAATVLLCDFIKSLGNNLQHLEFSHLENGILYHLDLSRNTNLRVLDCGFVHFHPSRTAMFPIMLSRIVLPCLEEIHFTIAPWRRDGMIPNGHLCWDEARDTAIALALPQFAHLRAVVILIHTIDPEETESVQYIQSCLPECEARGILKLRTIPRRNMH
ncbi:hypothetical protein PLICRDRAFT_260943 [Plicaturopsis crispa FD-325 SS-3]|nr:hypothetical protein PLICRDRAFT_260943 [Plicaturopsis crispa FD-325 SS-3]